MENKDCKLFNIFLLVAFCVKYDSLIELVNYWAYVTDFVHVRPKREHADKSMYFDYAVYNEDYALIQQLNKHLQLKIPVVPQLTRKSIGITIGFYRVTGISLPKRKIQQLPAELLQFTDLQKLLLPKNMLSTFPSEAFQSLQELDLSYNKLTTFAFSCDALLSLHLQNNQLIEFPVLQSPSLIQLILANNNLRELPDLSHLPHIKQLDVAYNELTTLSSQFSQQLEILNVAHNMFDALNLSDLPALRVLYAQSNHLVETPQVATALELLNIANNEISILSDLKFPNLQVLKAATNRITTVSKSLLHLPIRELFLGNNPITEFPDVDNHSLEKLYIEHTQITELHLKNYSNLQLVFVRGLRLSTITVPSNCKLTE